MRADAVGRERVPGARSAGWSDLRGAAAAGATLAFTSLHIPEDSPSGARAAATAIVSAAASSRLSVVVEFSPNTARLLGDSPWEFLRSIGVARVRIDFGFSVPEILSIAAVLPIALNASTLRAADLAPFADLDVELIHNFYPREWTGVALTSVASSVAVARSFGWRVGAFIAGDSVRREPLGEGLPTVEEHRTMPPLFQAVALVDAGVDDVYVGDPALTDRSWSRLRSFVRECLPCSTAPLPRACTRRSSRRWRPRPRPPRRRRHDQAGALAGALHRAAAARGRWAAEACGSVTAQLSSAGRFCVEAAITLRDPTDEDRAAVVGLLAAPVPEAAAFCLSLVLRRSCRG
ncbi:MupG family TIM beta-alpha barrel fold protein [Curtobacterium oceanosedimentum]|nr:MupG family TIM beta-alpha barrel fold protein [Curtobacterium oceanosedimentum]